MTSAGDSAKGRELTITRIRDAPRDRVEVMDGARAVQALVAAERLAPACKMDLRVGGE